MPEAGDDRAKKIEEQTKHLHSLLGEFAASFELVCFYMRNQIVLLMSLNGLRDQQLAHALCAELTATPLLKAFHSIALTTAGISEDGKRVLGLIYNRTMRLIEDRNDVVHGTWFIGWGAETDDFSSAAGFKAKNAKAGTRHAPMTISEAEFRPKIAEAKKVGALILRTHAALLMCATEKRPIESFFIVSGNNVDIPTAT